jgi:hypothetical protein
LPNTKEFRASSSPELAKTKKTPSSTFKIWLSNVLIPSGHRGDQSFIFLALLDGNKDGVVITSLHSRENTRFYVKSVKGGVGIDHPLSEEEQKTINRKGK